MTKDVITVGPDDTMATTVQKMLRSHVHGIPVVEEGRVVQIVTTFDVLRIVFMQSYSKTDAYTFSRVRDFMKKKKIITISPYATIRDALALFVDHNIRFLPVEANDTLVGILSLMDVAAAVRRE